MPQDPSDVRGKILRYNADGSIPADNPFGPTVAAWATGLRNVYGLAFDPAGNLFAAPNGPTGDIGTPAHGYDLAFMVERGGRYQWPACYGYSHLVPGATSCLGRPEPELEQRGRHARARPARRGSTPPARRPTRATSCSATRSPGCGCSCPALRTRRCSPAPTNASSTCKQGPDHALYFSDQTAIYRLGTDTTHQ